MEAWKRLDGFDKYEISDFGRIRNYRTGRILRPSTNPRGYRIVKLSLGGVVYSRQVHRLVVEHFIGPIPSYLVVNHKNLNKTDNYLSNLELCTLSENMRHAVRNGVKFGKQKRKKCDERIRKCIENNDIDTSVRGCIKKIAYITGHDRHTVSNFLKRASQGDN